MRRPDVLLAGEQAVITTATAPNDEPLATQLARLGRKTEAADAELRRLADLYQARLIELTELHHRAHELDDRRAALVRQRQDLADQRTELATGNRLRRCHHRLGRCRQLSAAPSADSHGSATPAPPLHLLTGLMAQAEHRLPRAVADARGQDYSWAQIADLLGVTRASA